METQTLSNNLTPQAKNQDPVEIWGLVKNEFKNIVRANPQMASDLLTLPDKEVEKFVNWAFGKISKRPEFQVVIEPEKEERFIDPYSISSGGSWQSRKIPAKTRPLESLETETLWKDFKAGKVDVDKLDTPQREGLVRIAEAEDSKFAPLLKFDRRYLKELALNLEGFEEYAKEWQNNPNDIRNSWVVEAARGAVAPFMNVGTGIWSWINNKRGGVPFQKSKEFSDDDVRMRAKQDAMSIMAPYIAGTKDVEGARENAGVMRRLSRGVGELLGFALPGSPAKIAFEGGAKLAGKAVAKIPQGSITNAAARFAGGGATLAPINELSENIPDPTKSYSLSDYGKGVLERAPGEAMSSALFGAGANIAMRGARNFAGKFNPFYKTQTEISPKESAKLFKDSIGRVRNGSASAVDLAFWDFAQDFAKKNKINFDDISEGKLGIGAQKQILKEWVQKTPILKQIAPPSRLKYYPQELEVPARIGQRQSAPRPSGEKFSARDFMAEADERLRRASAQNTPRYMGDLEGAIPLKYQQGYRNAIVATGKVPPSKIDLKRAGMQNNASYNPFPIWLEGEVANVSKDLDLFGEVLPQSNDILDRKFFPVHEMPLADLKLSKDVPNFKENADEKTGVVEGQQLEAGRYERRGTAPIVVWERLNGDLEVITGRHRLDLARRLGEQTIPAQVVSEKDGFDVNAAKTFDAESNIRDGMGTVRDYANYFRNKPDMPLLEAQNAGLLARAKGRTGWNIGKLASDEVYTQYRNNVLGEDKADAIASGAPNNADVQKIVLKNKNSMNSSELGLLARNLDSAQKAGENIFTGQGGENQLDLFDVSSPFMREMTAFSKAQASMLKDNREKILAVRSAVKRPEVARKMGVDVKNPQSIKDAIEALEIENRRILNPDGAMVKKIREAAGLPVETPPQSNPVQSGNMQGGLQSPVRPSQRGSLYNPSARHGDLFADMPSGEDVEDFRSNSPTKAEIAEAKRQYNEVKAKWTNPDGSMKKGYMLAPNGKPSNLTEEQWIWVRTPNFKKWFGDWEKEAYAKAAIDFLENTAPVATLTGGEFQKDGVKLTDKVSAYFNSIGNLAHNEELGNVVLDLKGVEDSLAHGIGRVKAAAFMAVKDVIEKGFVFNRETNWKNRGWDTAVIVAPIKIGGENYICEVVVKRVNNSQRFYLHEVETKRTLDNVFKSVANNGNASQVSRLILGKHLQEVKGNVSKGTGKTGGLQSSVRPSQRGTLYNPPARHGDLFATAPGLEDFQNSEESTALDARHADLYERYKNGDISAYEEATELVRQEAENKGYITEVYHGTGADGFNVALADSSKSEYGEGNQAHGRGLYMAENRDTAESYKRSGERKADHFELDGKTLSGENLEKFAQSANVDWGDALDVLDLYARFYRNGYARNGDFDSISGEVLEYYNERIANKEKNLSEDKFSSNHARTIAREFLDELKRLRKTAVKIRDRLSGEKNFRYVESKGRVFDWLHNMKPDELLDEQKPYRKQPKIIQNGIERLVNDLPNANYLKQALAKNERGKDIYSAIDDDLAHTDNDEFIQSLDLNPARNNVREILLRYGIRGITYNGRQDGRVFVSFEGGATVKLQDPFTFDDDGNLIPLSERFNKTNPDMRFNPANPASNMDGQGMPGLRVQPVHRARSDRFGGTQHSSGYIEEKSKEAFDKFWKLLPREGEGGFDSYEKAVQAKEQIEELSKAIDARLLRMPELIELFKSIRNGEVRLKRNTRKALGFYKPLDGSITLRTELFKLVSDFDRIDLLKQAIDNTLVKLQVPQAMLGEMDIYEKHSFAMQNGAGILKAEYDKLYHDLLRERKKTGYAPASLEVFAHELGHALDDMPEGFGVLGHRGNILGHLASTYRFLKKSMPIWQGGFGLDAELRKKMRADAEKLAGKRPDPKKDKAGYDLWRDRASKIYETNVKEYCAAHDILCYETATEELHSVLRFWHSKKPGEPLEAYYTTRPEELFAESFSVFLNNPEAFQRLAPTVYKTMLARMKSKPTFWEKYEELQRRLNHPEETTAKIMRDVERGWKESRRVENFSNKNYKLTNKERIFNALKAIFNSEFSPIYSKAKALAQKEGLNWYELTAPIHNFRYRSSMQEAYVGEFNAQVLEVLDKAQLAPEDLARYEFLRRVISERHSIANPGAFSPREAIIELRRYLDGLDKPMRKALVQAEKNLRRIRKETIIDPLVELGAFSGELTNKIAENNVYVPFVKAAKVEDFPKQGIESLLSEVYGKSTGALIHKQFGNLGDIKDPLGQLLKKDLQLINFIARQKAIRNVVDILKKTSPEWIAPAEVVYQEGKGRKPIIINRAGVGTLIELYASKPQAWYVPSWFSRPFEYSDAGNVEFILSSLGLVNRIVKSVLVQYNPFIWPILHMRDVQHAVRALPGNNRIQVFYDLTKKAPRAFAAAISSWKGKPNQDALNALKRGMLVSRREPYSEVSDEHETTKILREFGIKSAQLLNERQNVFARLWLGFSQMGQITERATKIASTLYLDKKYADNMSESQKQKWIRMHGGSPDFNNRIDRHALPLFDTFIMLFANPLRQAFDSEWELMKDSGKLKWIENMLLFSSAGVALYLAGKLGLPQLVARMFGGEEYAKNFNLMYAQIPQWDKANRFCLPIDFDSNGKTVYLCLPYGDTERLLANALMVSLNPDMKNDVLQVFWGEFSGGNPVFDLPKKWGQAYIGGENPSSYKGAKVIDPVKFEAGQKFEDLARYSYNQTAGVLLGKWDPPPRAGEPEASHIEWFLSLPIIRPLIGRYIKVSNRGLYELADKAGTEYRQEVAAPAQLVRRDAVGKVIGGTMSREDFDNLTQAIRTPGQYNAFKRMAAESYMRHDPAYDAAILGAKSNEEAKERIRALVKSRAITPEKANELFLRVESK